MASRTLGALLAAAGGLARTLGRISRQVFHEVVGALFVALALGGAVAAWRSWQRGVPEWQLGVALAYTAFMAVFAALSFRDARRAR